MEKLIKIFNHDFQNGNFSLYDEKGNKLYFENSSGYWEKRKYDNFGNMIYYEDSEGLWEKYKYDKNRNEIYWENSNDIK